MSNTPPDHEPDVPVDAHDNQAEFNDHDNNDDAADQNNNLDENPEEDEDNQPIAPFLPSDHRLMQPIQRAFKNELVKRNNVITLQLREKEASVEAIKQKREELGVELYSTQQSLAKLQIALENIHRKYEEESVTRKRQEERLKAALENYQSICKQREELDKKRLQCARELDALNITVHQIEQWNDKVKSEIKITRRAAYGTEDDMQSIEKMKAKQDAQLDALNEEIRVTNEQITLYDNQIASQKAETAKATATLREAEAEMERILVEKRKYLNMWRTSLQGMAARDEALEAAHKAVFEQQEKQRSLQIQLIGYRNSIKSEQAENEKLTTLQNRIESEIKFMEQQLTNIQETRRQYNNKYTIFRQTLDRVDSELKIATQDQRVLKSELDALHKNYEKLMHDKQEIDDAIMESINDQTTLEKGAQNVWKLTQKLKSQVHEKEIAMGDVQNEIARIQVDALNTGAHNKELQNTLEAYEKELKEKVKLIEKYEMEIRQRHDKIEKKQIYIARLNRKFEVLTSNVQEENTGPLEATINNLQKEIATLNKEVAEKQRDWIKTQTELVTLVSECNTVNDEVHELSARQTIYHVKKQRSLQQGQQLTGDIKEIQSNIKAMHHDMARLNELIATQSSLQSELSNSNFIMENEFMMKLKNMELKSVEMDSLIVRLRDEKESIFQEVIEVEKQIMLWEKKIVLERETQEALDPEYGQPEIQGMKKEIHRMKLRLVQLKREQEKMIQEMERTIAKRETIKVINTSSKSSVALTAAQLKKKISTLKSELSQTNKESKRVIEDISKQEEQNNILSEELEKQQSVYNSLEENKEQLQEQIEEANFKRQMSLEATILNQKRAKRYEDAMNGKTALKSNKEQLMSELVNASNKFLQLKDAVQRLQGEHPKYANWFNRLLAYM